MPTEVTARWSRRMAVAALTATAVLSQFVWIPMILGHGDLPNFTERDWIQFFRTGNRIAEGLTNLVYPREFTPGTWGEFNEGLYFLYPPFVAWVTLPLASLTRTWAYAVCVATVSTGTLLATWALLSLARATVTQRLLSIICLWGSAPWNAAVFVGHLSSLLLLSPTLAIWAWSRGRPILAGCLLGILLAKPNWGFPVLGLLLIGRQWRMAGGFLLCGACLVLTSLPLGPELWGDWWETMMAYHPLSSTYPIKQSTLLATVRSLTGRPGSHPLVLGIWVSLAAFLMGWTGRAWLKLGRRPEMFPKLLSVSLLAILVANPYVYVYDVILLTPVALTLWISPSRYQNVLARRWAKGMSIVAYYWIYIQLLNLLASGWSLVGVALAAWLVMELVELESMGRRKTEMPQAPTLETSQPPHTTLTVSWEKPWPRMPDLGSS